MRAVQMEHADPPAAIAEDHEVLAEDADAQRRLAELAREGHRLPEAAQIFAARRARAHLRQLGIGRRDGPAVIAVEPAGGRPGDTRSSPLHGTPSLASATGPVKRRPTRTIDLVPPATVVSNSQCR